MGRKFMIAQGFGCNRNIILQDNKSRILLENNGKASSGKRTRHMNICFFNITNRVEKNEAKIMWVPREDMVAYYLTKPCRVRNFVVSGIYHEECLSRCLDKVVQ